MSTKKVSIAEILLWICIVLLILVSLSPFALGYKIKSDYTKLIDEISTVMQMDMQIESYNQGYFSSDCTLSLSIPGVSEPLLFKENIIHGPVYLGLINQGKSPFVAAVINGESDVSAAKQDMILSLFFADKPMVYQNIIDYTGNVELEGYVPASNVRIEENMATINIVTSGMVFNESYSIAQQEFKGDLQIPSISISSDDFTTRAESLTMSFSGAMGTNNILIGDSVGSVAHINFDSGEGQFSIRDMTIRSITSESGQLINSGAQISTREILASNQKFGPVEFNMSVNGLNAQSLSQLQSIQQEVNDQITQGIPAEQANAMMMGQIMGILPQLISQAEIKINPLSVNSELGKLEADMDFSLQDVDENTPADPMFLMGAINLDLNLSIDEQLFRQFISWQLQGQQQAISDLQEEPIEISAEDLELQVKQNIDEMMAENWIIQDEGVYFSKINMHQGELLINDKAVDPMQQVMSSMNAEPAAVQ